MFRKNRRMHDLKSINFSLTWDVQSLWNIYSECMGMSFQTQCINFGVYEGEQIYTSIFIQDSCSTNFGR